MDPLNRNELKRLLRTHGTPCVSAYLPTHRAFPRARQDPIRFKNLMREADRRLREAGLRPVEAERMLQPALELIDDGLFWQLASDGLAVFIAPNLFAPYRLPLSFDELLVVTDRFHTKPLLALFGSEERFYLLALGRSTARLYECTRHGMRELELHDVPQPPTDVRHRRGHEPQMRPHVGAPAAGDRRSAIYHGLASEKGDAREDLLKFCRLVDHQVGAATGGSNAPLVLACVDHLANVYRSASHHHRLLDGHVAVNPDEEAGEELLERAWGIVEPFALAAQRADAERFRQMAGGGRAATDPAQVVPAAFEGRVDTLFVAVGVQRWGTYDPATRRLEFHPEAAHGDEDLLDLAAAHAYASGAAVHALRPEQMPVGEALAAIFRY